MKQSEKIKWLAENVMGFSQRIDGVYEYKTEELHIVVGYWNPYENWSDCGMLIEKTNFEFSLYKTAIDVGEAWVCEYDEVTIDALKEVVNVSLPYVITEAIYKAYKGDE